MAAERIPPRFVPTLTDVVAAPTGLAARVLSPPRAPEPQPALEALVAARVQAVLQERLDGAVRAALRELEPLVREAVAEALAAKEQTM